MDLYLNGKKVGTLVKREHSQSVSGGVKDLNQKQCDAYQRAKSQIAAGQLKAAKATLENAGFELLPSSRGPDDRLFDAQILG